MRLAVGTTSEPKLRAVAEAIRRLKLTLDIQGIDVDSGVSRQPIGFDETTYGAVMRARRAVVAVPNADMGLGIESGILHRFADQRVVDGAVCVLVAASGRVIGYGVSALSEIPAWVHDRLVGGVEEHGEVIRELTGVGEKDTNRFYSHGALPRDEVLVHGIIHAFVPFVSDGVFSGPPAAVAKHDAR